MAEQVSVVIGAGKLGTEVAERLARDSVVVLADFRREPLSDALNRLVPQDLSVAPKDVDVRNRASVRALAAFAASYGDISRVVCAAGVSHREALVEAIINVDMAGTAIVLEEFERVIAEGAAGVVLAGISGHVVWPELIDDVLEKTILETKPEDLITLPAVRSLAFGHDDLDLARASAYGFAKRVNHLHVRGAAARWAVRGARINSVSPGDMTSGAPYVASVVDFLLGPGSGLVTGTDVLVDGGALAAARHPA